MTRHEYATVEVAAEALAAVVADQLAQAIDERGRASLAVPGGSTPAPFMEALAKHALPWRQVDVTTTDERIVPLDHPRSNARLVRNHLLHDAAADANLYPLDSGLDLADLSEQIANHFATLDVCVLGMGDDGHTASLFPGGPEYLLATEGGPDLARVEPPGDLEPRITLSLACLLRSRHIHLLISGDNKRKVLESALAGDEISAMPVRGVLQLAGDRVDIHHAIAS